MPAPSLLAASFSLTALLVSVNLPRFKMPPPLPWGCPLRTVTPLMRTLTPEPIRNTLALVTLLLPSMIVLAAPAPMMSMLFVMFRSPVVSSSDPDVGICKV